jgi:hypothetical protein
MSGFALEPANNQAPWRITGNDANSGRFDTTVYYSQIGGAGWQSENIASSSDVDYLFFVCPGTLKVREVAISFTHSKGDLDVEAYDVAGRLLGTSTGTTNSESVGVSAFGLNAVVLKVYGYNGATGAYAPSLGCS